MKIYYFSISNITDTTSNYVISGMTRAFLLKHSIQLYTCLLYKDYNIPKSTVHCTN